MHRADSRQIRYLDIGSLVRAKRNAQNAEAYLSHLYVSACGMSRCVALCANTFPWFHRDPGTCASKPPRYIPTAILHGILSEYSSATAAVSTSAYSRARRGGSHKTAPEFGGVRDHVSRAIKISREWLPMIFHLGIVKPSIDAGEFPGKLRAKCHLTPSLANHQLTFCDIDDAASSLRFPSSSLELFVIWTRVTDLRNKRRSK